MVVNVAESGINGIMISVTDEIVVSNDVVKYFLVLTILSRYY